MDPRTAYKDMLRREVAPFLRRHGFKGSGRRWTTTSAEGIHGVVEAQASVMSTPDAVLFAVNVGAVPDEWLHWQATLGLPSRPTATDGLWWERVYPLERGVDRGGEPWWQVSNVDEAARSASALIARLREHSLPRLHHHLERDALVEHLKRAGDGIGLVVVLAERGPSPELSDALAALAAEADRRPDQADHLHGVIEHVQDRAAAVLAQSA
jgi:hypothetical protein